MATERTLSIIKPDATRRNLTGAINARFEESSLKIVAQKRLRLELDQARRFYAVHKERAFYEDLCNYMISGPIVISTFSSSTSSTVSLKVIFPLGIAISLVLCFIDRRR